MEHIYEEIKERHHQKLRVPAAIISSIMFTFLITVFLMMTNNYIQSSEQLSQDLSVVSNTAEIRNSSIAASN
ncbi:MAG: hypothetical protein B7Y11_02580 [Sphingobacteriia bacterium 24-36-13]|jgi:hypothetical protein|uniref:hypothetical protein n=1 Tax=Sediminibacterium sp. TaxID=1917865 RepID=UPI000BCB19BA|nr:hypothetical protein [Sediminibacterium sp.]OYY09639.1 MAG: hypothetical protein B7Y66_08140 [Sphingobacteriia bacterium 35-36-14]OYZ55215.1 MAG: hypothetical protein B7Y11_02580 [Sphingobacteriia bacterium 24-36-13]OZA65106.1 MAG: hypothetical protein B7X68_05000 [Sphingobacteriia bacterium 39-36-14]HQS25023.1 hypothetical protein [Sediminibacterium sp.]HQS35313.1 hypothetical protein [Sediminibacterium sp.]